MNKKFYGWGWFFYGANVLALAILLFIFGMASILTSLFVMSLLGAFDPMILLVNLLVTISLVFLFSPIREFIGKGMHKDDPSRCFVYTILLLIIPFAILPVLVDLWAVILVNTLIILFTSKHITVYKEQ